MDGTTLKAAFGRPDLGVATANALAAQCNHAMLVGQMTTVRRCAMFVAQLRQESVGLRYVRELDNAAGTYLRNQPYWPYIGRTYIQITWRANYAAFGTWCVNRGLLTDPYYFVKNLTALEGGQWAWLGPVWFFATHGINAFADKGDIVGASYAINGGDHGLAERKQYWQQALALGARLLPADPWEQIMSFYANRAEFETALRAIIRSELDKGVTTSLLRAWDDNNHDKLGDTHNPETLFMGIPGYRSMTVREAAAAAAQKP